MSNPNTHVKAYLSQANLFLADLGVHCKLFLTTLTGSTFEWYYSVPRNFINLFNTFCARFLACFANCKPMVTMSTSLHNVVQGNVKTLWQYVAQFAKAFVYISNLNPNVVMHTFLVGLFPRKFFYTLCANPLPLWKSPTIVQHSISTLRKMKMQEGK